MLQIRNLSKSFGDKTVLREFSLTVRKGEILLLLGKNGAGKSTLINCLLRLIRPDSGEIFLEGKPIQSISQKEYFRRISALLESSENVYDYLSGRENLEYFQALSQSEVRLEEWGPYIAWLGLEEAMDKKVGTYSRGMRQKLALLMTLLSKPQLLILDEPDLGLDLKSKADIACFLNHLAHEKNVLIFVASHQIDFIEKLEGRLLVLKNGKVFEEARLQVRKGEPEFLVTFTNGKVETLSAHLLQKQLAARKEITKIQVIANSLEKDILEVLDD